MQAEVPWELNSDDEITALGVGNLLAGLFAGGGPAGSCLVALDLQTYVLACCNYSCLCAMCVPWLVNEERQSSADSGIDGQTTRGRCTRHIWALCHAQCS